jgi:asparagine synthase (glutamine-hydrolysing)
LILPLTTCRPADLRPVIQSAIYYSTAKRRYEPGPWDEEVLWLSGSDALEASYDKPERVDFSGEAGGYYTMRSNSGFAFVRAATFRHRPSQADALNVDLWWRGINVALDPGTYRYNAPEPWDNSLAHSAYHNTVTIDGRDQMDRAGRFLWLPWLHSRAGSVRKSASGNLAYWEGEHDGYQRLKNPAVHRRAIVRIGDEHWLIADKLDSRASHLLRLHWLLADCEFEWNDPASRITLRTIAGDYRVGFAGLGSPMRISVVQADPSSPRGWRATTYNHRLPAVSVGVEARASAQTFFTVLGPQNCDLSVQETRLRIKADDWEADLKLGVKPAACVVKSVVLSGAVEDLLELS